ncbi:hypothetical protein J2X31_001872 [Flavobacterium arsenatis]|uniref:Uncharacterized protein n=1 Tax=Flavobacterium arsenatis TaxID=1484332 RepID=A0ABU1TPF5_9FLAO|nr:hypothetical protein [Flavobacterium arsenatis]MDR6967858.1 hypothetical protein [Flavobacterium arsenatis]
MFKKLIQYIIPINVLIDISLLFFEKGGVIPIIRALFLLFIIIKLAIENPQNTKYYKWNLIFCFYVLINVLFSTDIAQSLSISLKIIISMLTFIIGFNTFNSFKGLKKLNESMVIVLAILMINFIISSVFKLGEAVYSEEDTFLVGNLRDSWNLFTYSILVVPLLLFQNIKNKKNTIIVFSLAFFNFVILLLSIKRIAIVGVVLGLLMQLYLTFQLKRIARYLFILGFVFILSMPLYQDLLFSRLEARSGRFESGSLESEARYLETGFVWSETLSFQNPIKSFFGLEGFNSVGNYAEGKFGDRNLHVDYNLIVNTIGLVGLLLYFMVFVEVYRNYLKFKNIKTKIPIKVLNRFKALFLVFLFLPFFTSFGGQMYHVTFKMVIFIYLGAILGLFFRLQKVKARRI